MADTIKEGARSFVPPAERIATFDQEGTLRVSHPMYAQVIYALGRVALPAKEKPEIKEIEPFKTALTGDLEKVAKLGTSINPARFAAP